MPSYARLGITIFFFPSAHLSLHFWTTRKLIWRKKLCHFILYIFYHAFLNTDFFLMWSQYCYHTLKIAALFLCGLQFVQFALASLYAFYLNCDLKVTHTHLTFLRCTGPSGCQQQGYCPLLPEISAPWDFLALQVSVFPTTHSCSECHFYSMFSVSLTASGVTLTTLHGFWDFTDMFSSGSRGFIVFKRNFRYF